MNIDAFAYLDKVSSIALALPGAIAATSYGTPSFKVQKKLFARMKEDGKTLVVYTQERDKWMQQDPGTFFITDHYKDHPMMLIDLATAKKKELEALVLASWQMRAPAKWLKEMKK